MKVLFSLFSTLFVWCLCFSKEDVSCSGTEQCGEDQVDNLLEIQILSDLHLEINKYENAPSEIAKKADILIIAGDFGNPFSQITKRYLLKQAERYDRVFFCAGNHEYYRNEYHETQKVMQIIADMHENLFFMNKRSVHYKGVQFIGTTLWSWVPKENEDAVTNYLNDYHIVKIKDGSTTRILTVNDTNKFFLDELEFIEKEIQSATSPVVVITHHAPLVKGTSNPVYETEDNKVGCGFCTDLERLIKEPIKLWVFGHTHFSSSQTLNGVEVMSNQYGYHFIREITGFDEDLVVEIKL